MRSMSLILAAATLGACSTAPETAMRSPKAEARLQSLLAGKVAGHPQDCIPDYRTTDMVVIDDQTVLFRHGRKLVFRNDLRGSCSQLGGGHYTLLTRRFGSTGLCRGEIANVVDLTTGITVGSCTFGDFVPYSSASR